MKVRYMKAIVTRQISLILVLIWTNSLAPVAKISNIFCQDKLRLRLETVLLKLRSKEKSRICEQR